MSAPRRRLPVVDQGIGSLRSDGSRIDLQQADVSGRYHTARKAVFVLLMAVYLVLPWVQVKGHPAVFLDLAARSFYLFGQTFNAQDVWLMFFLLTGVGFSLVVLTTLLGRVWCGWACPQTVYLDGIFRPIERLIGGNREARLRRAAGPWSVDRVVRGGLTHGLYLLVAFLLAHVFVSYFVSLPALYAMMRAAPAAHPEVFVFTFVATGLLYFNFAHFREQLCLVVCPYGRLQAALTDDDSMVVGYDALRGEPRGKVARGAEAETEKKGDCVDCRRCVVVCPTGIDIRNGLQLDCIGCTACIDACDDVMDKLHRPRGLVRYDSLRGLEGKPRKVLRPRLALYAALGLAGLIALTLALRTSEPFEANLIRLRGAPFTLEEGAVRNAFTLHIVNKRNERVRYRITAETPRGVSAVIPLAEVSLDPLGTLNAPVFLSTPRAGFVHDFEVPIHIRGLENTDQRTVRAPFLGPSQGAP